jgi:lysozyme
MKISQSGKDLIKRFEGCKLQAYQDQVGVWTIGYGHTQGVKQGDKWTQAQADSVFDAEVEGFSERVAQLVKGTVAQCRFDALVSLAYNIGLGNLSGSKLLFYLNQGEYRDAALQFTVWNKAGGVFNKGLLARRTEEMYLFCQGSSV